MVSIRVYGFGETRTGAQIVAFVIALDMRTVLGYVFIDESISSAYGRLEFLVCEDVSFLGDSYYILHRYVCSY